MKPFIKTLRNEVTSRRPIWFMRQAGRYLPEYRRVRAKAGSFLKLCYTPELATEVTLQPIRRFGFDAAILFADILLIPHALGQKLEFREGEGPALEPIRDKDALKRLDDGDLLGKLEPIFETVERVAASLASDVALIGFCGAPWTVATYMVEGGGSRTRSTVNMIAAQSPDWFEVLINQLVRSSVAYLSRQIEAGAEAVQIFDTWAGDLSGERLAKWCLEPTAEIVAKLRKRHPTVPIIGFPRGIGKDYQIFAQQTGVDCLGLDADVELQWARRHLQPNWAVQGNLDPKILGAGGEALERGVRVILETLERRGHVFNLGHGITPDVPIAHVQRVIDLVRQEDGADL